VSTAGLATALIELQRSIFQRLEHLSKVSPGEADRFMAMVIAHLRAFRPEAVSPLGALGPPTEPIRDPRGPRGGR
jgi:hypothetical protein